MQNEMENRALDGLYRLKGRGYAISTGANCAIVIYLHGGCSELGVITICGSLGSPSFWESFLQRHKGILAR